MISIGFLFKLILVALIFNIITDTQLTQNSFADTAAPPLRIACQPVFHFAYLSYAL